MYELLNKQTIVPEFYIAENEKLRLDEVVEAVKGNRLVMYKLANNQHRLSALSKILQNPDLNRHIPNEYPEQATLAASDQLGLFWNEFVEPQNGVEPINAVMNIYKPGYVFAGHFDMDPEPTDAYDPLETLTFLYTATGQKNISFYLNGKDAEPTVIEQNPGDLLVFQGGGCMYPDGTSSDAIWHEVLPQDVNNVTISWELSATKATS